MPEFPLDDVPAGVAYYRDVLGFEVNYQQHDSASWIATALGFC